MEFVDEVAQLSNFNCENFTRIAEEIHFAKDSTIQVHGTIQFSSVQFTDHCTHKLGSQFSSPRKHASGLGSIEFDLDKITRIRSDHIRVRFAVQFTVRFGVQCRSVWFSSIRSGSLRREPGVGSVQFAWVPVRFGSL